MITGKIIGGLIGLVAGGPFTGLLGLFVGHQFDRGLGGVLSPISTEQQQLISNSFFETVFSMMGHLAKSDGRISQVEISQAESLMANMGLDTDRRRQAIEIFKLGAAPEFSVKAAMTKFMQTCDGQTNLKRQLLNHLISLAMADGEMHPAEQQVLQLVAEHLGFSAALFAQFIEMVKGQSQFRGSGNRTQKPVTASELDSAYLALGVKVSDSDAEIKKAYRKLISQNHPDKLIGQGMPEDMVKLATERTQSVQTAYDLIVASRA